MKNKKALLVSGAQVSRSGMFQFLEILGFEIVQALNGAQAVEIYMEDPSFDLILLDTSLTGLNGFTTAKLLRQHQIAKRAYIIGTSSDQESSVKSIKAGMDAHIVLPMQGHTTKAAPVALSIIRGGLKP